MHVLDLPEIQRTLCYRDVIDRMRDALVANSRGECDTPMPMHLDIAQSGGEVHIKSSYRRGGSYFVLKIAGTFPQNLSRGLSTGNGMMLLSSAETGEPVALLEDAGHLTDVRTAAAAAMVARELRRSDTSIGILGTGIQARLQARMHGEILPLSEVWIWGRNAERTADCRREVGTLLPNTQIFVGSSPDEVARHAKLIITCTASRAALLSRDSLQPGTHLCAVGSDSPGKQELDAGILRGAALILVDSRRQCEKLGELQHAPAEAERAVEIGSFCETGNPPAGGITVADFTGLGVEDLYIAEYCFERARREHQ